MPRLSSNRGRRAFHCRFRSHSGRLACLEALSLYRAIPCSIDIPTTLAQLVLKYIHSKTGWTLSPIQLLKYVHNLRVRYKDNSCCHSDGRGSHSSSNLWAHAKPTTNTLSPSALQNVDDFTPADTFASVHLSLSPAPDDSPVSSSPGAMVHSPLHVPVSMSRRRLESNIPVLHSRVILPPLPPCWEEPPPASDGVSGSLPASISRRWPLSLIRGENDHTSPVTPVDQIMHTPDAPPSISRTPLCRPSVSSPFSMTSYTDPMACSPLASPSLNDAGADMWPSFSIEGETSYLSSSMTSLYSPSGTDVRANSRHPILRLNTTSLRPPASAPRISPSTGFFNILRAREQPLRMGIARRLSYNLHTPSPPTPPMGGGDSDMPLASPFIITSLRPHPPSSPIPTRPEQRPLGTPTPLRSPADGSNYFSVV